MTGPSGGVRAGLMVSIFSLVWTLVAGTAAIAIGIGYGSLALVAFGAIGLVDAVGSAALIVHFRHTLRHEVSSERREQMAHTLVTVGMAIIGTATVGYSAYRLTTRPTAESQMAGIVIASVSIFVLALLSRRKRSLAERISSPALNADGWLSAVGSALAAVTLAGTALQTGLGWWWADPVAAIGVGLGAIGLGLALSRSLGPGEEGGVTG